MDDDAIGDGLIESMAKEEDEGNNHTMVMLAGKRSHDPITGCPIFGVEEFEIGAAYRLSAPNFFCNLSMPVDKQGNSQSKQDNPLGSPPQGIVREIKLPFPAWETTKVIHFVRDPIDMALSNYLYHSQYPTPEPWIKRRDINPCTTDDQFLNFTLDQLNGATYSSQFSTRMTTKQDLQKVSDMCRYYKDDHPIAKESDHHPNNNMTRRSFYGIMRRLPAYDGLRFATSHLLMANSVQSGGDLLRMANNVLRLQEWDAAGWSTRTTPPTKSSTQHTHVMTMTMGKIVKDMKGSILEICDYLLVGHISNVTLRGEIAESIAEAMVARYEAKAKASQDIRTANVPTTTNSSVESNISNTTKEINNLMDSKNWTIRQKSHVTQGIVNDTVRQLLKRQLEEDPILGHILLQIREIASRVCTLS